MLTEHALKATDYQFYKEVYKTAIKAINHNMNIKKQSLDYFLVQVLTNQL